MGTVFVLVKAHVGMEKLARQALAGVPIGGLQLEVYPTFGAHDFVCRIDGPDLVLLGTMLEAIRGLAPVAGTQALLVQADGEERPLTPP